MFDAASAFERVRSTGDFCTLRHVREVTESIAVRRQVADPMQTFVDEGVMVTVVKDGGLGYAATTDLSNDGIYHAAIAAREWAVLCARRGVVDFSSIPRVAGRDEYCTPESTGWEAWSTPQKLDYLQGCTSALEAGPDVVDSRAAFAWGDTAVRFLTSDGGDVLQRFTRLWPAMSVTVSRGSDSQTRSMGRARGGQGGLEILEQIQFREAACLLGDEARELLAAPRCPDGTMDLVLGAEQMVLQVHESIGHPLELDRVLGDERNYAGTSFVRPEDFGSLQYGSELLNVTFDPTLPGGVTSCHFDDDGSRATHEYLIRDGLLLRGLGGATSQARLGVEGVACSRASSWNRPPIDRLTSVNVEPGSSSLTELVAGIERGVLMDTNCSWSIDDSRHKFQFGCEWGRVIEGGELKHLVRTPGYRGTTVEFWHSLDCVGDTDTLKNLGTPNCGKGEPNQLATAAHSVPACRFRGVQVFGGG